MDFEIFGELRNLFNPAICLRQAGMSMEFMKIGNDSCGSANSPYLTPTLSAWLLRSHWTWNRFCEKPYFWISCIIFRHYPLVRFTAIFEIENHVKNSLTPKKRKPIKNEHSFKNAKKWFFKKRMWIWFTCFADDFFILSLLLYTSNHILVIILHKYFVN